MSNIAQRLPRIIGDYILGLTAQEAAFIPENGAIS
jgi:hypothetical protein